jgi:hypothetical protein
MALRYNCPNCGSALIIKFLNIGDKAWCKTCHFESIVPESAVQAEEEESTVEITRLIQPIPGESISSPLPPLPPLGKLLSKTIDTFIEDKQTFIILTILVAVISIFSRIAGLPKFSISNIVISSLISTAFLALEFIFQIPIILTATGAPTTIKIEECFSQTRPLIIPYVITSFMLGIILILSLICLIIPAFLVFVWFNFSLYIVVIERKYYFEALSESKNLVKKRWWEVFRRIILPNLLPLLLTIVSVTVISRLNKSDQTAYSVFYIIFTNTINAFLGTLIIIFDITLYKYLKGILNYIEKDTVV